MGQYIMSEEFMANALKSGYDKFNRMAKNMYDVINTGINMSEDKNFILLTHVEVEEGKAKIKTLGKLLDDKVNLAGLFTYVFYTTVKIGPSGAEYKFATNTTIDHNGVLLPAKTPIGMFSEILIPNDLGVVVKKIEEYQN